MIVSSHERARYYLHVGRDHLNAGEQATLGKHLDACAECRAYAIELESMQTDLARAMRRRWQGQHPRPVMTQAVWTRGIGIRTLRRVVRGFGSLATAAGAVGVVAALAWLLMTTGSFNAAPPPTVSQPHTATMGQEKGSPAAAGQSAADAVADGATALSHRVDVPFSESIRLVGYDVSRVRVLPGDTIKVHLYWRASVAPPLSRFNVIVRLLDGCGRSVAHSESIASRAPKSRSAQEVVDEHILALADTLLPGSYRLVASTYITDVGLFPSSTEGSVAVLLASIHVE